MVEFDHVGNDPEEPCAAAAQESAQGEARVWVWKTNREKEEERLSERQSVYVDLSNDLRTGCLLFFWEMRESQEVQVRVREVIKTT